MIEITHIKWAGKKIGIALRKLQHGLNYYTITAVGKDKKRYFPKVYKIDREAAIEKYGVSVINKGDLEGIWVPLSEIEESKTEILKQDQA